VALDDALEALALAGAADVDQGALREDRGAQVGADRELVEAAGGDAELADLAARGDAGLLEEAELGLGGPRLLLLGEADLQGA
jgi:hypothetical protein